jgi:dsDNA-binding SOS-regulon protein
MDNVTFIKVLEMGVEVEHAIIDHGNEEFTSMSKAEYDRRQAEQSTPNLAD